MGTTQNGSHNGHPAVAVFDEVNGVGLNPSGHIGSARSLQGPAPAATGGTVIDVPSPADDGVAERLAEALRRMGLELTPAGAASRPVKNKDKVSVHLAYEIADALKQYQLAVGFSGSVVVEQALREYFQRVGFKVMSPESAQRRRQARQKARLPSE